MSGITWWNLEAALADLAERRLHLQESLDDPLEQGAKTSILGEIAEIDAALIAYIGAIMEKADNIHSLLRWARSMEDAAAAEVKARQAAVQRFRALQDRVKGLALAVMESRGIKKAMGTAGRYLLRKGNGGIEPLQIDGQDERGQLQMDAPLPSEYRDVVVRMPAATWDALTRLAEPWSQLARVLSVTANQERIREALGKPCRDCGGMGSLTTGDERSLCLACGGDGRTHVPGARLLERGEHIECKG